jgi:hypothetical protein
MASLPPHHRLSTTFRHLAVTSRLSPKSSSYGLEALLYKTFCSGQNSCPENADNGLPRNATFIFRLQKPAGNTIVKRELKVENVEASRQPDGTDLQFQSYCSEPLGDEHNGFSVFVSPNFQPDGHAHPIELRPQEASTTIANSVTVQIGNEDSGSLHCVNIVVAPSRH